MSEKQIAVDAVVVGAGFGGVYSVWKLRQLGLSVRLLEASTGFGGVWNNNRYWGARVDSEFPFYQLSIPEVYTTYSFPERFPDHHELRKYFKHVDTVLDISKDTTFNAEVTEARFDESTRTWDISTKDGHHAKCKYLLLCTGSTYKPHTPPFPKIETYKGTLLHTGRWPKEDVDLRGKKVGVIGAGSTGLQVVQEVSKQAREMTVFIRTPNICFPLKQRKITEEEQDSWRMYYDNILRIACRKSMGGFPHNPPIPRSFAEATPEQRQALYEKFYNRGGFSLTIGVWDDYLWNMDANKEIYDFWAKKTRARIRDPAKRDILAPLDQRHPFMGKRPGLEVDYFECMDQDNVRVIDLGASPIEAFTESGIHTGGKQTEQHDFDVIILATGFDNYTGAFSTMGLKDGNGVDLKDRWKDGVQTSLGLMVAGYPNMWMVYGPQAPTALGNGPTIIETQIDIISDMIQKMRDESIERLEPTSEAAQEWTDDIHATSKMTLLVHANSWYMGANIPGKKREMLNYLKGLVVYEASCREAMQSWKGFEVAKTS